MKKIKTLAIITILLLGNLLIKAQCVNFTEIQDNIGIESETFGVSLADFDGDGYKDVVTIHAYNDIEIYFNNGTGDGTFNTTAHHYGDPNRARFGVQVIDIDNDGDMDFLTVPFYSESWGIEVWKNNGTGAFTLVQDNIGNYTRGEELAVGDLNNDGFTDIFYPSQWEVQIFLNDGTGYFVPNGQDEIEESTGVDAALADFDGDGDLDAAVAKNISTPKQIWINDGDGNFTDSGQELTTEETKGVAAGDLDNDGDIDVFYACGYDELQVWVNDGLGNFMPGMDLTGLNWGATEIISVDLNYDGNQDLVTNGRVLINDLENTGSFIIEQYLSGDHDIEVADVNNDDFLDIYAPFFGSSGGDKVYIFDTPTIIDEDVTLCYGDSLLVINNWQTEAGSYLEYADCEVYTRYNLSFYDEINTEITEEGGVLSVAEDDAIYQWLDCNNNNNPIPGETGQTFTPSEVGIYAVEVTQNETCTALSDCYIYNYVGINPNQSKNISVYPNPTTGIIKLAGNKKPFSVIISDITGKTIYASEFTTTDRELIIDISNQPNGVYFINIQTAQNTMIEKIIKE